MKPKYELKDRGVYLDGEKIAHVGADGSARMLAGKGDFRDEVLEFLATNPEETTSESGDPEADDDDEDHGPDFGAADSPGAEAPPVIPTPRPPSTPAAPRLATPAPIKPTATTGPQSFEEFQAAKGKPPEGSLEMGDKDPRVIRWYKDNDPAEFERRYKGRVIPKDY